MALGLRTGLRYVKKAQSFDASAVNRRVSALNPYRKRATVGARVTSGAAGRPDGRATPDQSRPRERQGPQVCRGPLEQGNGKQSHELQARESNRDDRRERS
jgi:hypothetical protein